MISRDDGVCLKSLDSVCCKPELSLPPKLARIKNGNMFLAALKSILDSILADIALELKYSSLHPYYILKQDLKSVIDPISESDVAADGIYTLSQRRLRKESHLSSECSM